MRARIIFLLSIPFLSVGLSAQEGAALVLVAKVSGQVTARRGGEAPRRLQIDDKVATDTTITVGDSEGSGAVLVFSNGAAFSLAPCTEIRLIAFSQTPFPDPIVVGLIKTEPSSSRAKIALVRGEIEGKSPKLGNDSAFVIELAGKEFEVGGCDFRMSFSPSLEKPASLQLAISPRKFTAEDEREMLELIGENLPGANHLPEPPLRAVH